MGWMNKLSHIERLVRNIYDNTDAMALRLGNIEDDATLIQELKTKVHDLETRASSASAVKNAARAKRLEEAEIDLRERRDEINQLAYNRGYFDAYAEITRKLGRKEE